MTGKAHAKSGSASSDGSADGAALSDGTSTGVAVPPSLGEAGGELGVPLSDGGVAVGEALGLVELPKQAVTRTARMMSPMVAGRRFTVVVTPGGADGGAAGYAA